MRLVNSVAKLAEPSFNTVLSVLPLRKRIRLGFLLPRALASDALAKEIAAVVTVVSAAFNESLMALAPTYRSWKTMIADIAGATIVGNVAVNCDIWVRLTAENPSIVAAVMMLELKTLKAASTTMLISFVSVGRPVLNADATIVKSAVVELTKLLIVVVRDANALDMFPPKVMAMLIIFLIAIAKMKDFFNLF